MTRLVLVSMVALTLAGCGGSSDAPTDPVPTAPTPTLSTGFARTWTGDFSMICEGVGTSLYPNRTTVITVSGNNLTARLTCEDGTGLDVVATGSGNTATWTGTFSCPPSAVGPCATWVFTRTSVTYTLNGNGTLTAAGVGSITGCGMTTTCATLFSGS